MTAAVGVDVRVRAFILERFPLARKHNLKNSDALLESGILDSLGILDVVGFLEREFGIHIADDELLPENFKDVDAICTYVTGKDQRAGTAQ